MVLERIRKKLRGGGGKIVPQTGLETEPPGDSQGIDQGQKNPKKIADTLEWRGCPSPLRTSSRHGRVREKRNGECRGDRKKDGGTSPFRPRTTPGLRRFTGFRRKKKRSTHTPKAVLFGPISFEEPERGSIKNQHLSFPPVLSSILSSGGGVNKGRTRAARKTFRCEVDWRMARRRKEHVEGKKSEKVGTS